MLFRQATIFLSLAVLQLSAGATFEKGSADSNNPFETTDTGHNGRRRKLQKKNHPHRGCVQEEDCEITVGGFRQAVYDISFAYFNASPPGGDAKSVEEVLAGDKSNEAGCKAAYEQARGALNAAYAYDLGIPVLFKPTLTGVPYTYRNDLEGALSYFIGTECLILSGSGYVFPPGNDRGQIFQENGFGLANYKSNYNGKEYYQKGWAGAFEQDFKYMTAVQSQVNCDTALAIGRICFITKAVPGEGVPERDICVDKTFSFKNAPRGAPLNAVISSHHSSSSVFGRGTLTQCQNDNTWNPAAIEVTEPVCTVGVPPPPP